MSEKERCSAPCDATMAAVAAELTTAAYAVALQHGLGDSWVDLELDLWRALVAAIRKWHKELTDPARPQGLARLQSEAVRDN
jgi:hypothetical protein